MRIACLHTAPGNILVFDTALRELGLDHVDLVHELRADLLESAERAGGLTPSIVEETAACLQALSRDADAVLLTCSTVGPAVERAKPSTAVPVLRVDEALAAQAVRDGGRVVVLCAVSTTVEPTRRLFEEAARPKGASVEVRLVPSAWDLFRAGDNDGYLARIAEAADQAFGEGAGIVALAQASMAGAARLCRLGSPLGSPAMGLMAAVRAAEAGYREGRRPGRSADPADSQVQDGPMTAFTLDDLARIVATRAAAPPSESYTAKLLAGGPSRAAKKLGEEAVEAALAAVLADRPNLVAEAADVLYHLLVVLHGAHIPLSEVMAELERRTAQSGLAEKASRQS